MIENSLYRRLRNWGEWLNYDANITPDGAVCVSIESRYQPDAGDVFCDDPAPPHIVPDVPDAEALQVMIATLGQLPQYALAVRYGGTPCVMRWRRVGEYTQKRAADMAEIELSGKLKKSA